MVNEIAEVAARIQSIEAKIGRLEQIRADLPGANRLGFGLALEKAVAANASGPTIGNPVVVGSAFAATPTASSSHVGGHAAAGLTPATAKGAYGRLEPPSELVGYGNGRIPAEALAPVGHGNHRLYGPAARALNTLIADARAAGVEIGMTDSYRPLHVQERLVKEKGLYSQGGLAATPGTSNHGWGMATDLDLDDRALAWMRTNAWRYGYVEDVPREPWHWTYRPDE